MCIWLYGCKFVLASDAVISCPACPHAGDFDGTADLPGVVLFGKRVWPSYAYHWWSRCYHGVISSPACMAIAYKFKYFAGPTCLTA